MSHPLYPHLFTPLAAGPVTLRNRIVMGSMHTRLETLPDGAARKAAFYAERARGGVALVITGGYAPNDDGRMEEIAEVLSTNAQVDEHRPIVDAVHREGALIALQILHAGRYAKITRPVGASTMASPINKRPIHALTADEVERTIDDYARCARLAQAAGYDGVEIMGSEGYLITQFLARRTNDRQDAWGAFENRMRLSVEIVRRVREVVGPRFLVIFRASALDLVEDGLTADEIAAHARAIEAAGVDLIDTGIGWHEARVPTIGYMVPRAAWRDATARLKQAVKIPVLATNRINTPELAEELIASGDADAVSLARPLLADAAFANKAEAGRAAEINTCIACNQACLDLIFGNQVATCLVNPRACHEAEPAPAPVATPRRIAVVGGGAAGVAAAMTAAERGHRVTLFEAAPRIGGQLRLAANVPGKEFTETLRYFEARLAALGVTVRAGVRASVDDIADHFDEAIVATGVTPRRPDIPGIDGPNVARYDEILSGARQAGGRVAIIGSGGIGFDVAVYLGTTADHGATFLADWSVDPSGASPGGLADTKPGPAARRITMLQRSKTPPGRTLGATTGWAIRLELARRGVAMLAGVEYQAIDARGVHVLHDGVAKLIEADTVVVCAGQASESALADALKARGLPVHVIGGARVAAELDAMRAIREGTEAAAAV